MIKKVLIVDDIRANLYMLETLLKGHGFDVISAENGKDAPDGHFKIPHPWPGQNPPRTGRQNGG